MKKKRVTYGVFGMVEFQALINIGKATMKVNFTDGSMTAFGQNPAQFTTTNPVVQFAIQSSNDFKKGRIKIINTIELNEEIDCGPKSAATVTPSAETKDVKASVETKAEAAVPLNAVTADDAKVDEIEFDCNDDAKDYLEKRYGAKRQQMRTRAEIVAVGKTYGLSITFNG